MNISKTRELINELVAKHQRVSAEIQALGNELIPADPRSQTLVALDAMVLTQSNDLAAAGAALQAGNQASQTNVREVLDRSESFQSRLAAFTTVVGQQIGRPDDPAGPGVAARLREVVVGVDEIGQIFRDRRRVPQGTNGAASVDDAVKNISAYPTLTTEIGGPGRGSTQPGSGGGGGRGGGPGGGGGPSIEAVIRETIGRLPRYTDAKAFLSALNQSFVISEAGGQRVISWRRHSTAGQGELGGGVTGGQASIYGQARDALAAIGPLVAGLQPLRSDPDLQEMEAAREIVLSAFGSVVDELGTEGGPRVARVDQLFKLLLEDRVIGPDSVQVDGMVSYLQRTFGLRPELVNTLDEERLYTDFVAVQERIENVAGLWDRFRGSSADLGTRLVLLSRALQVVAESVDEVEAALDSVFVGEAERQVVSFADDSGGRMLVGDLLSWIRSFASEEAPEVVQTAGRRGVGSITSTTRRLTNLVDLLYQAAAGGDGRLPDGMRHPRVLNPLRELFAYLDDVTALADAVGQPPPARLPARAGG